MSDGWLKTVSDNFISVVSFVVIAPFLAFIVGIWQSETFDDGALQKISVSSSTLILYENSQGEGIFSITAPSTAAFEVRQGFGEVEILENGSQKFVSITGIPRDQIFILEISSPHHTVTLSGYGDEISIYDNEVDQDESSVSNALVYAISVFLANLFLLAVFLRNYREFHEKNKNLYSDFEKRQSETSELIQKAEEKNRSMEKKLSIVRGVSIRSITRAQAENDFWRGLFRSLLLKISGSKLVGLELQRIILHEFNEKFKSEVSDFDLERWIEEVLEKAESPRLRTH